MEIYPVDERSTGPRTVEKQSIGQKEVCKCYGRIGTFADSNLNLLELLERVRNFFFFRCYKTVSYSWWLRGRKGVMNLQSRTRRKTFTSFSISVGSSSFLSVNNSILWPVAVGCKVLTFVNPDWSLFPHPSLHSPYLFDSVYDFP